ncbi:MAG: DUF480 domain-containing protein [Planctomycetota bacterium]|jgi:uncharacterized protein YceH (UPF0502 family)
MELDRTERRILCSLIEKRWTTPDQYPLSLPALVAACNQKSNRDPVFALEEFEVEGAIRSLIQKKLIFVREKEGGRVPRYSERLAENLGLSRPSAAVLAELVLRGPQTAPELLRRGTRMAPFEGVEEVQETLRTLGTQGLTRLLPRRSGQRHPRWTHLLEPASETEDEPCAAPEAPAAEAPAPPPPPPGLAERVAALEEDVRALRERLDRLERSGSPPETPAT